jgi:hypothetical protein
VDKPAVVGIEGFGLDGASMLTNGLGKHPDALEEGIIAHAPVMLHIDDDSGERLVARGHGKEDAVDQKLKALECLVPSAYKPTGFSGPDLKDEMTVPFLLLDLHEETEVSEDGVQNFAGGLVHRSRGA